jgi:hypothetical protein
MPGKRFAATLFVTILVVLAAFQIALALGAPWGRFAMGGAFPGVYPLAMRLVALAQVVVYAVEGAIVISRAGLGFAGLRHVCGFAIWGVVALGVIAIVLNAISPSFGERLLWTPVAVVLFLTSLRVALAKA